MIYEIKGTKKGTIFCIHGNSSSSLIFRDLLQSEKVSNTKVAVDLKGHGSNQNNDYKTNDFTFESQKNFIIEQLTQINDEVLLIGHSLGGHLAIEIAKEVRDLKGLIIMGTPPLKKPINFDEAFIPVEELNVYFTENPSTKEVNKAAKLLLRRKSKTPRVIADFNNTNPMVRSAIINDISQNKLLDEYTIFTQLEMPKFMIVGDGDLSINKVYLRMVKNNCNDNCKIVDFNKCGHFPSIDKPKQFVRVIGDIAEKVFNL